MSLLTDRNETVVGMGDLAVQGPDGSLVTHALGSCIAICLHSAKSPLAGMVHYRLPDSKLDAARAASQPATFGDTGFAALLAEMTARGVKPRTLSAKLVGGACIPGGPASFQIGKRNLLIARKLLWKAGIRLVAQEVEGSISRTARMDARSGVVTITTPGLAPRTL